jgi:nucleoside diphosphate kinase
LGDENGEAVSKWRSQLGHWNVEAKRDLSTIRGRWARDNHNNLLHGSDSPESALREIHIVSNLFERALMNLRLAEAE